MIKKTTIINKNNKSYMSSYEWNYRVLDIIDYLENSSIENIDKWYNFKNYCVDNKLNWRVMKKMIEYSVNHYFESEEELMNFEYFKPLSEETNLERIKRKKENIELTYSNFQKEITDINF